MRQMLTEEKRTLEMDIVIPAMLFIQLIWSGNSVSHVFMA